MRFMQRKMEAEEARQKTLQQKQQQEQMEWTATEQDEGGGPAEQEEENASLAQAATPSDMYGAKSDLIGRRSFGGFRPHVGDTYKSACTAWQKGKSEDSKQQISDEELLRRYKDHVTGKADMDTTEAAPIGNLQEKLKKKGKRKSQSPHKGGKRNR